MLFSSIPFLYWFLPAVIGVYFLVPRVLKNTVLLVSHSMEDIGRTADRLLVMNGGHAEMLDETRAVFAQSDRLESMGLRVEVDYRNEKIGKKIRDAQLEKIPYMLVVGDRDMENGTVSPRHRADGDLGAMPFEEFATLIQRVVDNKEKK